MHLLTIILLASFGLAIGSFLAAYTFRTPRGLKISRGRSFCPRCKKPIAFYDNIPLLSFFLLKGRCRRCHRKISLRYPAIELSTAVLFLIIYLNIGRLVSNIPWLTGLSFPFNTIYLILIAVLLLAVLITDLEHQLVLDQVVFLGFLLTFAFLLCGSSALFYSYLLAGFTAAFLLLLLHLITRGRGMGLGDVKLALFAGTFLGFPSAISWLFLSFIVGAIVSLFLLALNKKHFGDRIAFGPFLVLAFFLILFFAPNFNYLFFPFFL